MSNLLLRTLISLAITAGSVTAYADANADSVATAREILKDSIAIRTVDGYGNVPEMAEYLADKYRKAGFPEEDIHILPVKETAALVVRYRGDQRSGKKPIMLSAHMDVVEANPEDWVRDPYTLIEEDGYFFGRGVTDDKFAIATLTTTLLRLKAEGYVPARDIILALSGDEETDMDSTKMLAKQYRDLIYSEYGLVADGGGGLLAEDGSAVSFSVDVAEKTYVDFRVTATNPGGHSSRPRADNAIYDMVAALANLRDHQFPVESSELTRAYFAKTAPLIDGELGDAMAAFAKDASDQAAVKVLRQHPEFGGATGTTCVATRLDAGHANNALPQSATAIVNCRIFPGIGVDKTLATLKEVTDNSALQWEVLSSPTVSDASPLRDDVFGAIERAVHLGHPNVPIIPHMALGGSDGMHFRAAGIPCYSLSGIFMKASDEFAHGLNERAPVAALPTALGMWYALLTDLTGDQAN